MKTQYIISFKGESYKDVVTVSMLGDATLERGERVRGALSGYETRLFKGFGRPDEVVIYETWRNDVASGESEVGRIQVGGGYLLSTSHVEIEKVVNF